MVSPCAGAGRPLRGREVTLSDEARLTGPLWNQLQETLDWLRRQLHVTYTFPATGEGVAALQRHEVWEIPRVALREALLNALLHRDYTALGAVQVRVYDNRVTINNPGGLAESLTIADLSIQHRSLPRNPILAELAYRMNLVEGWGTGTLRIEKECASANLPAPNFNSASAFTVTFYRPPRINRTPYSPRKQWTGRQIEAFDFVRKEGAITNRQYRELTGVSDEIARREFNGLVEMNVFQRVGGGRSVRYIWRGKGE